MKASESHSRFFYILRGILVALLMTVPMVLLIAGAANMTEFPEECISPAVFVSVMLVIVLSSFISSAWQKNCGWSNGTITGLVYMVCILVVRFVMEERIVFDKDSITLLLLGILLGSVSGYAGLKFTQISTKRSK